MGTRISAWLIAVWLVGCTPGDTSPLEQCVAVCQACSLGYCGLATGGGTSGWCYDATRRDCILAHEGECGVTGVLSCVMGPPIDAPTPDAGP